MIIIILTTTVFVQNKSHIFQSDPLDRIRTYVKSIKEWLKTDFKIIVVENSGYLFKELGENENQLEIISFNEKTLPEASYLKDNNSKGASEIFSINYALKKTKFKYSFVIKITGRYFIPNFESYLNDYDIYDAICQKDDRCEIVGCNYKFINLLFNTNDIHSHIEFTYKERINNFNNVKILPLMDISPTQRGGENEIRLNL